MQQNLQDLQIKPIHPLDCIPQGYSYFEVLPAESVVNQLGMDSKQSHIITFRHDSITFGALLKKYLYQIDEPENNPQNLILTMPRGYVLSEHFTVANFKKELMIDNILGVELRVRIAPPPANQLAIPPENSVEHFANQAATNCFLTGEALAETDPDYYLDFILGEHSIRGKFSKKISFNKFKLELAELISTYIKSNIKITETDFDVVVKESVAVEAEQSKIDPNKSKLELFIKDLYQQFDILEIKILNQKIKIPVPNVNADENHLILNLEEEKSLKIHFDNIKNYTVNAFLIKIGHKHQEKIKCDCGLKLLDKILRPHQKIEQFAKEIRNFANFAKNIEIKIIQEKHMFYQELPSFQKFNISEIKVSSKKAQHQRQCQDIARSRIRQRKQNKKTADQVPFETQAEINIITYYTSSLMVAENNTHSVLYQSLNKTLRDDSYSKTQKIQNSNNWKYRFTGTLLDSLIKIKKNFKGTVYRGVNLQFEEQKGDILKFKQFTSTSKKQSVVSTFVQNTKCTVYKIHCFHGKQITDFSYYKTEDEVLILPYTDFYVKQIVIDKNVRRIQLIEISKTPLFKSIPKYNSTFILWVDDKVNEGQKIFKEFKFQMESTFMFQLLSTEELKKWIEKHQRFLKKSESMKVRIAMITNMRRIENKIEVKDAGAHAIKLVQKQIPKAQILVFIGHIEGTKIALKNNGLDPNVMEVKNLKSEVQEFIKKKCAPRVSSENEEKEEEPSEKEKQQAEEFNYVLPKQDWSKFFESHLNPESHLKKTNSSQV